MSKLILPKSPSPSKVGMPIGRRGFLKGAAGAAGVATMGGLLAACGDDDSSTEAGAASDGGGGLVLGEATGELTIGSNYSNALPQAGLAAAVAAVPNENITGVINEVDHNTFQENITTYLQQPDDIIPWFAGYRMRFFAAQDLLGDITDVWGG